MTASRKVAAHALRRLARAVRDENAEVGLFIDGRYEVQRRLARGGMGEVFVARDKRLDRLVAMKVLGVSGPEWAARFTAEAQAMTKLEHPGIVPIHDFGTFPDGRLYYTMKYVSGPTLEELIAEQAERRGLLEIVARVCEVVQHAHRRGIIHRDLKPLNVIVDEHGAVYVLDWGIARVMADARRAWGPGARAVGGVTAAGTVMGTVGYMSPEQAEDATWIDERSDVYSLGAMLYEALCGVPPGETLEAVREGRVVPPRRRRPGVPAELEAICLKALEPDRRARYASAAHLEAELRRYLDGEPVEAVEGGVLYRVRKRAARWRWLSMSVAGALVLAVVLGVVAPQLGRTKRQLEETEGALLDQMRATSEACLKAALALRRSGDLEGMKEFAGKTEEICRKVMEKMPRLAEPHALLGRTYRAQMRFEEAVGEQEKAIEKEPACEPARYERGVLRVHRYEERVLLLREQWRQERGEGIGIGRDGAARKLPSREELEDAEARRWREGALEDLGHSKRPVALALVAWLGGKDDEASASLERAVDQTPYEEEVCLWLGKLAEDKDAVGEAIGWYTRGIERDRAYGPYFEARGNALAHEAVRQYYRGADPTALQDRAIADFSFLVNRMSARPHYWAWRGRAFGDKAICAAERGRDFDDLFRCAVEDHDKAVGRAPEDAALRVRRGVILFNWAGKIARSGMNAEAKFRSAIEDFDKAIGLDSRRASAWHERGGARTTWGGEEQVMGKDPIAFYQPALADFTEAIRLDAARPKSRVWRADLRLRWGCALLERGQDGEPHLAEALKDLDEAQKLDETLGDVWRLRAGVLLRLAIARSGTGANPSDLFGQALAAADQDVRSHAGESIAWRIRATIRDRLAPYQAGRGEDPAKAWRQALKDFDAALRINPADAEVLVDRAEACMNWALFNLNRGRDPSDLSRQALANYYEAIRLQPNQHRFWMSRGRARMKLAQGLGKSGKDPVPLYELAEGDLDEAVRLAPTLAEARIVRANLHNRWAAVLHSRGDDPSAHYRQALRDYEEAAWQPSESDETWVGRGWAGTRWGDYQKDVGADPTYQYQQALSAWAEALRRNPTKSESWRGRGEANAGWADFVTQHGRDGTELFRAAVADGKEAVRLGPEQAENWRALGSARGAWLDALSRGAQTPEAARAMSQLYEELKADFAEAIRLDPDDPETFRRRGQSHQVMRSWREALGDYENALRLSPAMEPRLRPNIFRCRKALGEGH